MCQRWCILLFVCTIDIFALLEQTLRKLKETYLQLGKYQTNFSCAIIAQ